MCILTPLLLIDIVRLRHLLRSLINASHSMDRQPHQYEQLPPNQKAGLLLVLGQHQEFAMGPKQEKDVINRAQGREHLSI